FEVFLVSLSLRARSVEEVLGDLRRARPQVPLVLMADPDEVADAVSFFRAGIEDYLIRPLQSYEVRARLGRILERHDLDTHVSFLTSEIARRVGSHPPVTRSREMEIILSRIERIAPMRSTVLILGESGVGKELVARSIHFHSPRKSQPFVALNCAAIPVNLIESDLFGHEKGAFTGAVSRAPGKFEIAHGGTLFLDEIGEMRRDAQEKLP